MSFHRAASLDDLWSGELRGVVVSGRKVLLIRFDDVVHAFEDRCAHQAVELSKGRLDGPVLTCSAHEWQYDARSGEGLNPRGVQLRRYPVRLEDGWVLVDVADQEVPA